tara:strand:+ start:66 stop:668 length:603 start_codon:yes stop_codon:yes gene_type:complete
MGKNSMSLTIKPYFIIILGPPAVGKMTIGQELAKETHFKLFHNHMIIELLLPIFGFDSEPFQKLVKEFRTRIFQEIINEKSSGLVFTFVINFKNNKGSDMLLQWINLFQKNDFTVCVVELQASLNTRLQRNETPNRLQLQHKSSKRDLEFSRKILLKNEEEWIMQSPKGFFKDIPYLKMNTETKAPQEVVNGIIKYFKLK